MTNRIFLRSGGIGRMVGQEEGGRREGSGARLALSLGYLRGWE